MFFSPTRAKRPPTLNPEEPRTLSDFVLLLLTARVDKHLNKLPDHIHGAAVDAADVRLRALVHRASREINKIEREVDALAGELEAAAGFADAEAR